VFMIDLGTLCILSQHAVSIMLAIHNLSLSSVDVYKATVRCCTSFLLSVLVATLRPPLLLLATETTCTTTVTFCVYIH
jgi:hypothetical protein